MQKSRLIIGASVIAIAMGFGHAGCYTSGNPGGPAAGGRPSTSSGGGTSVDAGDDGGTDAGDDVADSGDGGTHTGATTSELPCTRLSCDLGLVCNTTSGKCVECVQNGDCAPDVCNTTSNKCVRCMQTSDCSSDGGTERCARNECVAKLSCISDNDCRAMNQLCDLTNRYCIECQSAADCKLSAADECTDTDCTCVDGLCAASVT